MSIRDPRPNYRPFEYPWCHEYYEAANRAHWVPAEISLKDDVQDYIHVLDDNGRNVISNVLKVFTQQEIPVGDYWSSKVTKWFPKPEIRMVAQTFGSFEVIHTDSYSRLNDTLPLGDDIYLKFLEDPAMKQKIDYLVESDNIPLSLAIFSAFTEGVSLYSHFAILASYSLSNTMMKMAEIISYSVRDESMHSEFGCRLFNAYMEEFPEENTSELRFKIQDAAGMVYQLESTFIDKVFELGDLPKLSKQDLKNYIQYRINLKLSDIGQKKIFDVSKHNLGWFDKTLSGVILQDFFAGKETSYAKGSKNWDEIYQ
jgi:ribonucleoside-diphosphate reductase beta chain